MGDKKEHRLGWGIIFIILIAALFLSIYTFILQNNYKKSTLEFTVTKNEKCADAIHVLMSNKFTKDDFNNITSKEDMNSTRYLELQQKLNELRSLNSTRYLYTAKEDENGKIVYLIDGLDLDAEDFAYPGTYIEEEVTPYIKDALKGKTTYSQEIIDTTWGHIFTACYPVKDHTGEIMGALCMEMDMEDTYKVIENIRVSTLFTQLTSFVILIVLGIGSYLSLNKYNQKEQKRKEMLKEAAYAADVANKAKSSFLSNMSHDIRTPMNAIIGYTLLADKYMDDHQKIKRYHEKIRICGQRMLSILDNILEISRIEKGQLMIEKSAVQAGKVLDECLLMVKNEIDQKQQTLIVKKEIIYPYIYFDTTCISEIILNLLSNATKYTGKGGQIECIIKQSEASKEGWINQELIIKDNGIGMSEEFQEHIYEMFSRERNSTMSGVEGTGLGMGIVKNLVDLMDGTIDLESKLGEGSTFRVCIPCRIASFEDTQPKRADKHIDKNPLLGKRILLAEDNDLNAEIAIELLNEEGMFIDRVKNGVECIEQIEKQPADYYSLILMDIQMPILDGYYATQKIRRMNDPIRSHIPIIAMTANAFAEDKKKALEFGMNDHIAKPIDMNIVIQVLKKYI